MASELRPTLRELTPLLKQLVPNVEGFGRYLPEISAFFANAASATQAYEVDDQGAQAALPARDQPGRPENLAAYQRRIGSNRTLPYIFASAFGGAYTKFTQGLDSFETRHCGRPTPILAPDTVDANPIDPAAEALVPRRVAVDVKRLAFGDTPRQVPAPACNAQAPFPTYGVPAPGDEVPAAPREPPPARRRALLAAAARTPSRRRSSPRKRRPRAERRATPAACGATRRCSG